MYYRRKLPHWHPDNAEFFVTFRLAGSLPKAAINKMKSEKQLIDQELANQPSTKKQSDKLSDLQKRYQVLFKKYEELLDSAASGPTWLSTHQVAEIISEAIHYRNSKQYDLYAYCIMPNHVHIVLKMITQNKNDEFPALTKMLQGLKSFTALKANKYLNRSGSFWQAESFDRVIRNNKELESTIKYVLFNPIKAGLTENWQDWPFSFCKPEFKNGLFVD